MNNIYRKEITEDELNICIFNAWKAAITFIEKSQDEYNEIEIKPEYLITVKIAEQIVNNIIGCSLSNFALKLEEDTKKVFKRCFKEVTYKHIINKLRKRSLPIWILRDDKDSEMRSGKIDITIYKKKPLAKLDSYHTYAIIEAKNFESHYKLLSNDLRRIEELISQYDEKSENLCKYGILTFSRRLNNKETGCSCPSPRKVRFEIS